MCFAGALVAGLTGSVAAWGQQMPLEPHHDSGQSVTGVFEGWFKNADGTFMAEMGYYNRNLTEAVDVPTGPNNRIEPGGPDLGQPTHFLPGKMWGNFIIKLPADLGDKRLQWTLTVNGKTTVIPINIKADWEITPFADATGDTPPFLSFSPLAQKAPTVQGPIPVNSSMKATVGEALPLTVYVADDGVIAPGSREPKVPVNVRWFVYRQNGAVTFANTRPVVEKTDEPKPPKAIFTGKATTTATFSEPGDYILEVVAMDATGEGGGGFQCCWTNGMVKVTVSPKVQNTSGGL